MILTLLFFLGASLGSFLTLILFRVHQKISIIRPRSFCDCCHHPLNIKDLIPVISYLFCRGKCRFCNYNFSSQSFQMEFYLGLSLVNWGLTFDWLALIIEIVMGICYLTDLQELRIYTICPLILIACVLPFRLDNLISSLFLTTILFIVSFLKKGLGVGDILLLFPLFLFLGITMSLFFLILSCSLVIVIYLLSQHFIQKKIPFVPYLSWGFLFTNFLIMTLSR